MVQNGYTYDPAGNVLTRTDNDGTIASFGYNGADQLTAESYYQGGVNSYITYSYDHNGNRTTQNVNNSALTTYAYDAGDKLTSDSTGDTYTYDQNGNWTKLVNGSSTYVFQYDAENKLTYYQSPTGASSSYVYNGMGLRVTESDSGTSGEHDYLHDGAAPASGLLVDSNLTGSQLFHVYTPGIDQSDAGTGAVHLMAVDALGTVRGFVNNSGQAVTDTFGSLAFGAQRTRTGSDAFSLAWGGADGYQTDANGLILLGNRVYHPYTGRFLTRDPAHAGSNDYEYAQNNPLAQTDPSGLYPQGVVDHGGPGSAPDQWFSGDDFSALFGGLAGTSYVPVYNATFAYNAATKTVTLKSIDGLAGYIPIGNNPLYPFALDFNPNHWQVNIRATSFSGRGDPEHSAYPPGNLVNPNALGAALPAHHLKGVLLEVMNATTGVTITVPIVDVGPLFGDALPDNAYWETDSRPAAEDPSTHADYYPKSTAGIDLTPAALAALGLPSGRYGGGYVDWRFAQ